MPKATRRSTSSSERWIWFRSVLVVKLVVGVYLGTEYLTGFVCTKRKNNVLHFEVGDDWCGIEINFQTVLECS